jgi:hypothetical protein
MHLVSLCCSIHCIVQYRCPHVVQVYGEKSPQIEQKNRLGFVDGADTPAKYSFAIGSFSYTMLI